MIRSSIVLCVIVAVAVGWVCSGSALAAEAKNVIIFVSDGGGFSAYRAASYYQHGRLGGQPYDVEEWRKYAAATASLNTMGSGSSSYSSGSQDRDNSGYDPNKIWHADSAYAVSMDGRGSFQGYGELKRSPTDSAASGTAMAAGAKVFNSAINYIPDYGSTARPARGRTIAELAKAQGKSTGIVTSVYWSDATPSTFGGAHSSGRGNKRDIANQMLSSGTLDLIMGGGHPEYDKNGAPIVPTRESDYEMVGGSFTWELLTSGRHSQGWKLIQTRAEFEALMNGPTPRRVVGIPRIHQTLQQQRHTRDWNRDGRVDDLDARMAPAFGDPFIATVPTLTTMTKGALNMLGRNPKGFYVMIEGGAVDWAGHANQPGRIVEEMVDFNAAIAAAQEWVARNSSWDETLIIITSDHETGLLLGPNSDRFAFDTIVNRGAGRTPGMHFNSGGHSNQLVPLFARGAGAELFESRVRGHDPIHGPFVENTSIFEVMRTAMGGSSGGSGGSGGYYNSGTSGGYNSGTSGGGSYSSDPYSPGSQGMYDSNGGGTGRGTPSRELLRPVPSTPGDDE